MGVNCWGEYLCWKKSRAGMSGVCPEKIYQGGDYLGKVMVNRHRQRERETDRQILTGK